MTLTSNPAVTLTQPGQQPKQCVVCASALPRSFGDDALANDPYPCCKAIACRMIVSRRDDMGDAGFRHYLQLQARHTQHRAAMTQLAMARKAAEAGENELAFDGLRRRLGAAPGQAPLRLLLPHGPRRANKLGALRRARYRAHLVDIIAEAALIGATPAGAIVVAAPAPAAPLSTLPGQLCAMCGGGCCTRGGDKAYLSAETMRRVMDARPALSPDAVLAAYMERLVDRTQAGSCINHTGRGCSLPHDMRSDICNRFSCESLAKLQAAQRAPEAVHTVLVVRRKQDHWHRNEQAVDNAITGLAVVREAGTVRIGLGTLNAATHAGEIAAAARAPE